MVDFNRITRNPEVMDGKHCIRGMQVTVDMIIDQIRAGVRMNEMLKERPYLEREDILQALGYAAWRAEEHGQRVVTTSIHATESGEAPRCSWCDKPQGDVAFLIATPTGRPRAYICDECIAVCDWLLEERCIDPQFPGAGDSDPSTK